ncbi:hypothetical protein PR202_ga24646 [Eleusine coracana subsp. coracana]|uniref:F-box protein n=1 Tax=Eleusine coracana subsp. coracana TaxID=191504 RepID=A0AAV5D9E9_ELECO|nr:hypothetical protein PR202_ga24646 [Eleusine coracana subsp. coracana]
MSPNSSTRHTYTDYIRFHAVCKPWRQALLPAHCNHAFLPWLFSPRDASGHRMTRCVFSCKSRRLPDERWVVRAEDGTVAMDLTSPGFCIIGDPFAGSAVSIPLPPLSSDDETKWLADYALGTVSGDGTIILCLFTAVHAAVQLTTFNVSLLPGDTE